MSLYIGILASQGSGGALLDSYGGAAAAFSLRKLSSTYGGAAVRVRRSLDNAEQDIGFAGGQLDQAALQAFVGYENIFTYSEQFENASWDKGSSTITPNAGTDPLGGNNADRYLSNVGATFHNVNQVISLTVGQSYTVSLWVKSNTGSNQLFTLYACSTLSSNAFTATTSWQRFTYSFVATSGVRHGLNAAAPSTPNDLLIFGAQLNQGVTAQNYQQTIATANTANGFVTRWYTQDSNGENLLLQSQTFENAYWVKVNSSVSINATTAPDGTLTAEKLIDNTVNDVHYVVSSQIVLTGSLQYAYSFYIKAAEISTGTASLYYDVPPYDSSLSLSFNLTTGTITTSPTGAGVLSSSGISNVGNGWYRIWMIGNTNRTGFHRANIVFTSSNTGTQGFFIWGAQLSQSNWLQGYQATTTSQVFRRDASQSTAANQPRIVGGGVIERENGKATMFFDGVNDFFTGTDIALPVWSIFGTAVQNITNVSGAHSIYSRGSSTNSTRDALLALNTSLRSVNSQRSDNATFSTSVAYSSIQNYLLASGMFTGSSITSFADSIAGASVATTVTGSVNPVTLIGATREGASITFYMGGEIGEIIVYDSNRTSTRADIERNIGAYYQTQWTGASSGLLDQFGGAAAAYSLRNLSSSYRGPLIRVRRSSDNAETDIGGTYNGDLDVASLLSFTGGQNLLTYSEDFSNVSWTTLRGSITSNTTIAPDGTLTADSSICNTASASGLVSFSQIITSPSTRTEITSSCYFKAGNRSFVSLIIFDPVNSNGVRQYFNLTTGQLATNNFFGTGVNRVGASIQNIGNGWWRCSLTASCPPSVSLQLAIAPAIQADNNFTCSVGDFGYIWGAQLNTGILQPYIPTTTAAINGANAFVTKWYDQSGIGDNLVLQSETFGNASWSKQACTVSDNVGLDPFGTNNADKILEVGGTAQNPYVLQGSVSMTAGITYVTSCYLKAVERNFGFVNLNFAGTDYAQLIDLTSGSAVANLTNPSYVVENAGNGWWRLAIFFTPSTNGSASVVIGPKLTAAFGTYNTTANSGILIYGAQVSASSQLLRYQPTTTAIAPKRDAIQTTAASQPRIVNAGSVESENGKPSVYFTGTTFLNTLNGLTSNSGYAFAVYNSANGQFRISQSKATSPDLFFSLDDTAATSSPKNVRFLELNNAGVYNISGGSSDIYNKQNIATYSSNGTSWSAWLNSMPQSLSQISGSNSGAWFGDYDYPLNIQRLPAVTSIITISSNQEIVIFDSNLSATRASVESNINSYYQIYWQGNGTALLDSFSGASAAYSLRNLSSAYTGPLIRVRRSNDNAERDIYGTFRGDLDLAALTSFVGANSGFVTTWYDQSGIGDNLLLQSQTFENAIWGKFNTTITQDTITAPDGTLTADKISETAVNGQHGLFQTYNIPASSIYTFSFYVKSAERSNVNLVIYFNGGATDNYYTRFNLLTGTVNSTGTGGAGILISSSIQSAGDGWYRCSITGNTTMTGSHSIQLGILDSSFNATYVGVAGSGMFIWGAQLSLSSQLLRYQPTTTAIAPVRNAVQATAASQPRIVNAGAVETENGKPAIVAVASGASFIVTAPVLDVSFTWFTVHKSPSTARLPYWINSSTNYVQLVDFDASVSADSSYIRFGASEVYQYSTGVSLVTQLRSFTMSSTNLFNDYRNSVQVYARQGGSSIITDGMQLQFGYLTSTGNVYQEAVFYATDRSTARTAIESNINNYYKIY